MANYIATTEQFTATAEAIRNKTKSNTSIEWNINTGFANEIAEIKTDGIITRQDTQDSHGGTIVTLTENITTLPVFDFRGEEAEVIATFPAVNKTFAETSYATWTPSTTATTIFAATNISPTYQLNLANYDYMVEWSVKIDAVYSEDIYPASTVKRYYKMYTYIIKIPNGTGTRNVNITTSQDFIDFYNSSSAHGGNSNIGTYALYANATAATFNSATSNTPTTTFKTPAIGARVNTTYFSASAAAALDQENSTIKINGVLWRLKKNCSTTGKQFQDILTMLNNEVT